MYFEVLNTSAFENFFPRAIISHTLFRTHTFLLFAETTTIRGSPTFHPFWATSIKYTITLLHKTILYFTYQKPSYNKPGVDMK